MNIFMEFFLVLGGCLKFQSQTQIIRGEFCSQLEFYNVYIFVDILILPKHINHKSQTYLWRLHILFVFLLIKDRLQMLGFFNLSKGNLEFSVSGKMQKTLFH